ncbi:MAG: exodeoxyribonuclease VII large subunit [Clostridia bacterium]|nr:exodeoxyribonuclease VII large subunit [Clostridia bacterium]
MEITPISVEQLNKYIKNKVDGDEFLNNVYVKGEISNFKLHYTGHMYFTLKDEKALVKCVMFRNYTPHLSFSPKDGMKVAVLGSVSVFERDGVYQIYCKAMKQDGMGSLFEAYQKLKAKLEKEGLFDESHKKSIPKFPKTIGVLTASTGAVIRDIINVSTRRNPNVHIKLLPVAVQGPTSAGQIVEGIKKMNKDNIADVIILGRGGGSLEDLWSFNEEIVARAIYESEIPIISAVGHETDFSISDFVADLRAPTPSSAAELAVPNIVDVIREINSYENRYRTALDKKIELMKLKYEKVMQRRAYSNPLQKINEYLMTLDILTKKNITSITKVIYNKKTNYEKIETKLNALSPLKTLARGFTITEKNGKIITKSSELKIGDNITVRFSDGKTNAEVVD